MAIDKETATLGMPWEEGFGYAQGVRVGDVIYLAGQICHDEAGDLVGLGDLGTQMRQAYVNVARCWNSSAPAWRMWWTRSCMSPTRPPRWRSPVPFASPPMAADPSPPTR